ncbi:hypothetical protein FBU30_010830, partial [Linnemannia zychae]
MVGGFVGRPRMPHQHVVIAIGLAKFAGAHGPPGLNGTFQAIFVNLARSLTYLVVGINEYYTSKRCPDCYSFVCATSDWRTLYCMACRRAPSGPNTSNRSVKMGLILEVLALTLAAE